MLRVSLPGSPSSHRGNGVREKQKQNAERIYWDHQIRFAMRGKCVPTNKTKITVTKYSAKRPEACDFVDGLEHIESALKVNGYADDKTEFCFEWKQERKTRGSITIEFGTTK